MNQVTETDAGNISEDSQNLNLVNNDTLKYLLESLENASQGEVFTKTINHGSYTFTTSSSSDEDVSTTKCEIFVDKFIPNINPASQYTLQQPTHNLPFNFYPQTTGYNSYTGQVPADYYQPQAINQQNQLMNSPNYTDSGTSPGVMPGTLQRPPQTPSPSPMSALPSNVPYAGNYNFRIEFGKQPKDTKSTSWTYSATLNKLFAQKDALCPIKFAINCDGQANDLYIRALPIYSKLEYLQEVVKRCPNHTQSPESANIPHREHIIWCENQAAQYVQDEQTERFAVRAPYDVPPAGTDFVTYLFSFKCLNSCVGGPNRREMSIIFTLENASQQVLGRQCIDLRICACPGRDRKSEEGKNDKKQQAPPSSSNTLQQGVSTGNMYQMTPPTTVNNPSCAQSNAPAIGTVTQDTKLSVNKRPRQDDNDVFTVSVRGRRNYELLCNIRDSLEMCDLVPNNERERFLQQRRTSDIRNQQMRGNQQTYRPHINQPTPYQQAAVPGRLPNISALNFGSARNSSLNQLNIKRDIVDSTQRGCDLTDGGAPVPPTYGNTAITLGQPGNQTSVAVWLKSLGLGAYVDNFHNAGLKSMDQLKSEQNFTINDLENMKLTKLTVTQIWNALKAYRAETSPSNPNRNDVVTLPDSQGSSASSQGSAVTLSGSDVFRPPQLEFTRYSFKFTVLKRNKAPQTVDSSTEPCNKKAKKEPESKPNTDSESS